MEIEKDSDPKILRPWARLSPTKRNLISTPSESLHLLTFLGNFMVGVGGRGNIQEARKYYLILETASTS